MSTTTTAWKPISLDFNSALNDIIQQQHHAIQIIAMAGKHLLPQQEDDSNTNMFYDTKKQMIIGNELPGGYYLALRLTDMYLVALDKHLQVVKKFALEGKSKKILFKKTKEMLWAVRINTIPLKNELHYEIPVHALDKNGVFTFDDDRDYLEVAAYRNNAEVILNEIAEEFHLKGDIRVWPHHFDSGSFIPISFNKKGELTKSIGIGFAIPDSMVNEPYFYLSFWSTRSYKGLEHPQPLLIGNWMMPKWNGGVLKLSDIMKAKSAVVQRQIAHDFFASGLKVIQKHFKF